MCVVYDTYLAMYVWYFLKIFQIDFFSDVNVMACMYDWMQNSACVFTLVN